MTTVTLDNEVLHYHHLFCDETTITTTIEFLSHIEDTDLSNIPSTNKNLRKIDSTLTPSQIQKMILPEGSNAIRDEFLAWHYRLDHLSFTDMFILAENNYLPKKFLKLRDSQKFKCSSCIFAQMKRRPWKTGKKRGTIKSTKDEKPGESVSIDQLVSH